MDAEHIRVISLGGQGDGRSTSSESQLSRMSCMTLGGTCSSLSHALFTCNCLSGVQGTTVSCGECSEQSLSVCPPSPPPGGPGTLGEPQDILC